MKAGKNPMTREGYGRVLAEYEQLSKVERPKVVKGVSDAAAEGDRSENAEYIYGKKRLRELDKRLSYLANLLRDVQVLETDQMQGNQVVFGSTVIVRDEHDAIRRWTIVGEGEADMAQGQISWKSPVARALMGKSVNDVIEIEIPRGKMEVEILGIKFHDRLIAGKDIEK